MLFPSQRSNIRTIEKGFGLIEIIIAMIILAILTAIIVHSFSGAKKATYVNEAKSAASAYAQALSQYHADFTNQHPTTWTGNNDATAKKGPLNLKNEPYLKPMPEAVSTGRVGVSIIQNCASTPNPSSGTEVGWVTVCLSNDEPDFFIRVDARRNSSATWGSTDSTTCYLGATSLTPKC